MNTDRPPRQRLAGSALRRAAAAPQSRLRDRRHPVAGARRRRQHRDLPAARRGAPAHAAGRSIPSSSSRSGIAERQRRRTGSFVGRRPMTDQTAVGADARSAAGLFRAARLGHADVRPGAAAARPRRRRACGSAAISSRRSACRPLLGRVLTADDDRSGCAAPPAVLSYGFWQREYGGDPSASAAPSTLDGHPFDIVGVTPPGFFGVEVGRTFDVAVPLCAEPLTPRRAQRARPDRCLVPRRDRPAEAGLDGRAAPTRSSQAISPPIFQATLPPHYHARDDAKTTSQFKLGARSGGRPACRACAAHYESPLWLLLATTGARAADRLREPREPDARARHRARARDRRPPGHRRLARPHRPPAAAESLLIAASARRAGRSSRSGSAASSSPFSTPTVEPRVRRPGARTGASSRFTALLAVVDLPALRPRAGDPRHRAPPGRAMKAGSRGIDRRPRALRRAPRAGRRAGRAVAGAGRRRAAVRAQPAQSDDARCRLPAGRRARRQPRPATRRRSRRASHRAVADADRRAGARAARRRAPRRRRSSSRSAAAAGTTTS